MEEKKRDEAPSDDAQDDLMNKTMSELREEFGIEPGLNTAANKLRRRC